MTATFTRRSPPPSIRTIRPPSSLAPTRGYRRTTASPTISIRSRSSVARMQGSPGRRARPCRRHPRCHTTSTGRKADSPAWPSTACCSEAPNPYTYMYLARSDDGSSWASTQISLTGGGVNPAVGSDGTVYVGVAGATANQVAIRTSTDGGVTFAAAAAPVSFSMSPYGTILPNFGTPSCSSYISPNMSLAVDHTGGVNDGHLYLVWADNPSPL